MTPRTLDHGLDHIQVAVVSAARVGALAIWSRHWSRGFVGYNRNMLYMVIERYLSGPGPVYERAASRGRMLPDGLRYLDSWVVDDADLDRCFQLMETDDPALFEVWRARWRDLGDFEVFPVIKSAEAAARVGVGWPSTGDDPRPGGEARK